MRVEGSCGLDDGHIGRVTDQLGVVKVQDRVGDEVGTLQKLVLGLIHSGATNVDGEIRAIVTYPAGK